MHASQWFLMYCQATTLIVRRESWGGGWEAGCHARQVKDVDYQRLNVKQKKIVTRQIEHRGRIVVNSTC